MFLNVSHSNPKPAWLLLHVHNLCPCSWPIARCIRCKRPVNVHQPRLNQLSLVEPIQKSVIVNPTYKRWILDEDTLLLGTNIYPLSFYRSCTFQERWFSELSQVGHVSFCGGYLSPSHTSSGWLRVVKHRGLFTMGHDQTMNDPFLSSKVKSVLPKFIYWTRSGIPLFLGGAKSQKTTCESILIFFACVQRVWTPKCHFSKAMIILKPD